MVCGAGGRAVVDEELVILHGCSQRALVINTQQLADVHDNDRVINGSTTIVQPLRIVHCITINRRRWNGCWGGGVNDNQQRGGLATTQK